MTHEICALESASSQIMTLSTHPLKAFWVGFVPALTLEDEMVKDTDLEAAYAPLQ
jgi:hypothetical protein